MTTRTSTRLSKKQAREQLISYFAKTISGHTGPTGRQVDWTYQMNAACVLTGTMNDGITQLEIAFTLDQIRLVSVTKQGLMLHLASKATVTGPDGQQSYDEEWPLILDWVNQPGLKEELLQWFNAATT